MQAARNFIRVFIPVVFAAHAGAIAKTHADNRYFWYGYVVDSAANTRAASASIKCDADGNVKLAYRGHYDIKYAELKDHRWTIQVADTGTGADARMDMDLDGAGNPHIVYHDWSYNWIYYAHRDSDKKWSHLTVKKMGLPNLDFYQVSIAADRDGNANLAFTTVGTHGPYASATYAKVKDGKVIDSSYINDGGINGKWNSMTLDSQGKPVFAYYVFDNSNLGVATRNDTGGFTTQIVDSGDFANAHGFYASIARENDTSYYVSYVNEAKKIIQLAHGKPGGAWTIEKIDTMAHWTLFSSQIRVAVDTKGNPVIAYAPVTTEDGNVAVTSELRIAYKVDGNWVSEVVDNEGVVGEYLALTINRQNDMPVIAYWDRTKGQRKVVVGSPTAPPDEDHNGIPDYKELPAGVLRRAPALRLRGEAFPFTDTMGRTHGILSGPLLPSGAYFGPEGARTLIK
jgi:hypothetical protein